jgi:hypothetical protein
MEKYLRDSCGLQDEEQLRRLGIFLVAHTIMDTHLISVLIDNEAGKIDGAGLLSPERLRSLSDEIARHTFKKHLDDARGLIQSQAAAIAEEINRGRDAFVHFKRGRFELPRFNGQPVTEEDGLRGCMDAVREFLLLVPLRYVAWTANL